jgi:hypothetical protein
MIEFLNIYKTLFIYKTPLRVLMKCCLLSFMFKNTSRYQLDSKSKTTSSLISSVHEVSYKFEYDALKLKLSQLENSMLNY